MIHNHGMIVVADPLETGVGDLAPSHSMEVSRVPDDSFCHMNVDYVWDLPRGFHLMMKGILMMVPFDSCLYLLNPVTIVTR